MYDLTLERIVSTLCGALVGMILAIPVGPTAALCMRRTLEQSARFGFATGVGAAFADAFYGAVVAFGVAAISTFLQLHFVPVRLAGGLFMLVLSGRLIRTHARAKARKPEDNGPPTATRAIGALFSGFLLTVSNPMTLVGFASVMAPLHSVLNLSDANVSAPFVLGVFVGSAAWWLILTLGVRRLRHMLSEKALHRINLIAGVMLAIFGALALGSVALRLMHP